MRRVLALALLLCCVPAAGTDAPDPAFDRDGDGTVTRKEERQGRRAVRRENRRARRGLDGELEDDGGSTTEEDAARQQAAAGTAASLARSMNALLPSADAGALPSGGAAASAGARGPSAAARTGAAAPAPPSASAGPAPSGNPADPRTPEDLLLAARSGYSSALEKAGLRLSADGKGFVRVADGKPASAEDLERLRAAVVAMPAAIARRPDFHQKVPPEHFAALQSGYRREDRSPSVYKDVGATEKQRDFIHTRSCEKVSGDCNENTTRAFYKKGEHVSPEDLERMFQALSEELAAAEAEAEPDGAAPGRGESRPPLQAEEAAEVAASVSATRTVTLAEDEAAAFAAAPALLPTTLRRAWAKAVVAVSPSAAKTPAGRGALLAGLLAFAAAVALPFLRRRG